MFHGGKRLVSSFEFPLGFTYPLSSSHTTASNITNNQTNLTRTMHSRTSHEKSIVLSAALMASGLLFKSRRQRIIENQRLLSPIIPRTRRSVHSIIYELGPLAKRYYRMPVPAFWHLHDILRPFIVKMAALRTLYANKRRRRNRTRKFKNRGTRLPVHNGPIATDARLSIAL